MPSIKKSMIIKRIGDPLPLVNFEKKYMLFWTAKSGCSNACRVVLNDMGSYEPKHTETRLPKNHPDYINILRNEYFEFNDLNFSKVDKLIANDGLVKIKVVRNPYPRVVSGFLMLMRENTNLGADKTGVITDVLRLSAKKNITDITFLDFCVYLSKIDIAKCDWHIRRQKSHFEYEYPTLIDELVRLENFSEGMRHVSDKYGYDWHIEDRGKAGFQHHNVSDEKLHIDVANVHYKEYMAAIPSYASFFNEETKFLVEDAYLDDIAEYGYGFPYIQLEEEGVE